MIEKCRDSDGRVLERDHPPEYMLQTQITLHEPPFSPHRLSQDTHRTRGNEEKRKVSAVEPRSLSQSSKQVNKQSIHPNNGYLQNRVKTCCCNKPSDLDLQKG